MLQNPQCVSILTVCKGEPGWSWVPQWAETQRKLIMSLKELWMWFWVSYLFIKIEAFETLIWRDSY